MRFNSSVGEKLIRGRNCFATWILYRSNKLVVCVSKVSARYSRVLTIFGLPRCVFKRDHVRLPYCSALLNFSVKETCVNSCVVPEQRRYFDLIFVLGTVCRGLVWLYLSAESGRQVVGWKSRPAL